MIPLRLTTTETKNISRRIRAFELVPVKSLFRTTTTLPRASAVNLVLVQLLFRTARKMLPRTGGLGPVLPQTVPVLPTTEKTLPQTGAFEPVFLQSTATKTLP